MVPIALKTERNHPAIETSHFSTQAVRGVFMLSTGSGGVRWAVGFCRGARKTTTTTTSSITTTTTTTTTTPAPPTTTTTTTTAATTAAATAAATAAGALPPLRRRGVGVPQADRRGASEDGAVVEEGTVREVPSPALRSLGPPARLYRQLRRGAAQTLALALALALTPSLT